jgi:hypothetical protein
MLGLLVYAWSRQLFGAGGGLLSLLVYAFCPTLLAHGALATSDLMAAFFFMASVWSLWALLHRLSPFRLLVSAGALLGLFLSKMSAVLIVPVGLILLAIRLLGRRDLEVHWFCRHWRISGRLPQLAALLGSFVLLVFLVWVGLWAAFGFRYSAFREAEPGRDLLYGGGWQFALGPRGPVTDAVRSARDARLLPEAYLYGFIFTHRFAQQRRAFWNGEFSTRGWYGFFPYCLAVKTPPALFALLALAAAALVAQARGQAKGPTSETSKGPALYDLVPLFVFLFVYWAAAVASRLNIGHRHLLPTYPFLLVLAGGAAFWLRQPPVALPTGQAVGKPRNGPRRPRLASIAAVVFMLAFVLESLLAWPHYLGYFNVLAGGSRNGYKHLVDSSLDWGQDLPGLKDWLDARGLAAESSPVYLAYFGTGRPEYYGIGAVLLPCYFARGGGMEPRPFTGGIYCVSATMLQGVYLTVPGPWTDGHEAIYRRLIATLRDYQKDRENPERLRDLRQQLGIRNWADAFRLYEEMRFSRLCHFLRQREPIDNVGYSILIYSLTDEEVERAVDGPWR